MLVMEQKARDGEDHTLSDLDLLLQILDLFLVELKQKEKNIQSKEKGQQNTEHKEVGGLLQKELTMSQPLVSTITSIHLKAPY